ncbi:HugZ family protein [Pelagibius sp. Alg239-R121]|uniref:HugZ family pyridoxamine 5'-phosphate oxidase n=1 Tax=Pelagibius sp. Alg239-R121 TaxID=2993448 RepID=UPI0024A71644|nr:DUF2470 domain-containing protein [Pelagibius sp. Alg239-R121]
MPSQDASEQPTPAGAVIRGLMRSAPQVSVSTALARDGSGRPYVSLALVALDHDASPLLLLSDLADHTANLKARPELALLFDGTGSYRDPLAGPRASVLGNAEVVKDRRLLNRFMRRHPSSELYAGFKDFNLYRLQIESAHLVAGFGQIHWVEAADVLLDVTRATKLASAEEDIVSHMNQDHADAVALIAARIASPLAGRQGGGDEPAWVLTGVDPEGCDLRCHSLLARADFDKSVTDAETARVELVRLTKRARQQEDAPS